MSRNSSKMGAGRIPFLGMCEILESRFQGYDYNLGKAIFYVNGRWPRDVLIV
jgi:hypothetical protein